MMSMLINQKSNQKVFNKKFVKIIKMIAIVIYQKDHLLLPQDLKRKQIGITLLKRLMMT